MDGGGKVVGGVPESVLDLPEEFGVGPVDELLGHPGEGVVGRGAESLDEGVDAGLAVGVRGSGVGHGGHPGESR